MGRKRRGKWSGKRGRKKLKRAFMGRRKRGLGKRIYRAFKKYRKSNLVVPKGAYLPKNAFVVVDGCINFSASNILNQFVIDTFIRGNSLEDCFPSAAPDYLMPPASAIMQFYRRCRIWKSSVRVTLFPGLGTNAASFTPRQWLVALIPNTYASSFDSLNINYNNQLNILEQQKYGKWKYWLPDSNQGKPLVLKNSMKTKNMFPKINTPKDVTYSFNIVVNAAANQINADPVPIAQQFIWHLVVMDVSQSGIVDKLNYRAIVHVRWHCILGEQVIEVQNATVI